MRVHLLPLLGVERTRLREHAVGDPDLADVVQHAREPHALHVLLLEAELPRHQLRVAPDGVRVLAGAGVADVERLGERDHGGELERAVALGARLRERAGHLVAVDHRAVAAELLGGGHRAIGGAQQADGVGAVHRAGGHSEAHRHSHGRVGKGAVRGAPEALGHDERAALIGLRKQEGELLAADARRLVDASLPLEAVRRHELQGDVSSSVALALVHGGERIEIPHDHRQRAAGAPCALELHVQHLLEGAAVEEPCEGIRPSRICDTAPQSSYATALVHGKTRQRERADVRD